MTTTTSSSSSSRPYDDAELLAQMGWLRQIASKLVQDPTLADDLAQQAWLAAQREPRAWRTQGDLRAWLARVVQNMARNTARRDRRRKELEAYASGESQHAPATDELVARAQLQAELARTVLELDEPHKSVILLRFLDGLTHEEMSARLGVSADAARKRVERALHELRTRLDARHKDERRQWLAALVAFVDGPAPQGLPWPQLAGAAALLVAIAGLVPWMTGWGGPTPAVPAAPSAGATTTSPSSALLLNAPADLGQGSGATESGASLATTAATSFWLREASGLPASGYSVLCHHDGAFEEPLVTDEEGRIAWPATARPTALLVWRDDYVLQRLDVPAPEAEQVAILPEGALLAGVVSGITPGRPCHVRLTHDRPSERVAQLGFTGYVNPYTGTLEATPPAASGQMLALAADGSFRLRGLPADWSGQLYVRAPYLWATAGLAEDTAQGALGTDAYHSNMGGTPSLQLHAPHADLQAAVISLPCVQGRLVEGLQQTPVSRGLLALEWSCPQAGGQIPLALGADGRFWLPILPALRSCGDGSVRVSLPGRAWSRSLAAAELVDGYDLGVLVLPEVTLWQLLVVDQDHKPLVGAQVHVQNTEDSRRAWNQTGLGGKAEFLADLGTNSLVRIAHEGHLPRYVRTGTTAGNAGPILVQLERSAALEVRATDASGRDLQGALRVRAPLAADPARDWRDLGDLDPEAFECERRWNAMQELNVGLAGILNQGRNRAVVAGVARGIPLVVELLDSSGNVRTSATTSIPSDAWTQAVHLVWDANGYRIRGVVRDEAGAAIAGAVVEVGRSRAEFMTTAVSDAEGRYEFHTQPALRIDESLFVSKLGWAPVMTAARSFGPHDEEQDFVLQRSRPLRVQLVDAQNRAVSHASVLARFAAPHGELSLVRELEPGVHSTSDAPRVQGTVEVHLAGVTQSFALSEAGTRLPVALPNLGALQVTVSPALGSTLQDQEVEIHAQGSTPLLVLDAPCRLRADGSAEPLLVHLPAGTWTVSLRARSHMGAAWVTHGPSSTLDIPIGVDLAVQFQ